MVPAPVFARLADEATRIATQHLAGVTPLRRDAILAAGVIALETDLVDAALAMFEKLMAQYGRAAERRVDERAARSMREIQGDLRLFAVSGRALVDAHVRKQDLGVALQTAVGWRHFEAAVVRAEVVSAPDHIDPTAELVTRHRSVRLFGPALLQHLVFDGSAAMRDLLAALDVIRATYAASRRKLPPSPPVRFVPRRWRAQVIVDGLVDRPAYELCAFSELRERLRAGDVWVVGSGRYRAFGDYLLPEPSFQALRAAGPLPLAVPERFEDYLADRRARLETMASTVADLARVGKLADVRLDRAGADDHAAARRDPGGRQGGAAGALRPYARSAHHRRAHGRRRLDRVRQAASRTGARVHPCNDPSTLLTCVLADGINMGLTRMARTCRGASLRQLALAHDWHISEANYAEALARLIDAHRALPLAKLWGDGTKASSDGQHFFAGGTGEAIATVNARHGNEPGRVVLHPRLRSVWAVPHQGHRRDRRRGAARARRAPLPSVPGSRSRSTPSTPAGWSDHVFGLMPFFGYRFAPRMRDLKERRLHLPPGLTVDPLIATMVDPKTPIDITHAAQHWDELLRLATSIRSGTVTASAMLKRLSAFPRANGLAVALREIGRLERSIFHADLAARPRPTPLHSSRPEQGRGAQRARPGHLLLPTGRTPGSHLREPGLSRLRPQPRGRCRDPVEHPLPAAHRRRPRRRT